MTSTDFFKNFSEGTDSCRAEGAKATIDWSRMNEFLRGARSHLRGDVFFVSSATCKADGDVQGKLEFLRGWLCVISYYS